MQNEFMRGQLWAETMDIHCEFAQTDNEPAFQSRDRVTHRRTNL